MIGFTDDHRSLYGVEPICRVLPIAPSTYYEHAARRRDPSLRPARERRDEELRGDLRRVFGATYGVCGVRKVWRRMNREGIAVARCTVVRLMKGMGPSGAVRRKRARTTGPGPAAPYPLDRVNRQFQAPCPNTLWVSDFTCVVAWSGFVYVAFVIDAFAPRIVGWRTSRTAHAGFVLDAPEQALHERRPANGNGLVHHSDHGSQYLSIRYAERLAERGIEPPVGSVGDSEDNALAESVIGLFRTELIERRWPWRSFEAVELATLGWVDWFNTHRLFSPIGHVPPAEAEANCSPSLRPRSWPRNPNDLPPVRWTP
jgi:transposase InsO family protein